MSDELKARLLPKFVKVAGWAKHLAAWQGTSYAEAVVDHREMSIVMRIEANALSQLCVDKGLFTEDEWGEALLVAADEMDQMMQQKFPGQRTTSSGLIVATQPPVKGQKQ